MHKSTVITDLQRWGPQGQEPVPDQKQAEQYCRELAQSHYENFPVASWLLPRSLHQHFYNVYAFCRWADDLGDEAGSPERATELLRWWKSELNRCDAGEFRHPVFVALHPTMQQFSLSSEPFHHLISAFEQDQVVREYDTFEQLLDYCRRSANPVGRIVLSLSDRVTPQNVAWSDSICTGLQLANFWQDVARDFEIGRIYLPREDRERYGVTIEQLEQKRSTPEFQRLMAFQVERARTFLFAGEPLSRQMPGRLKVEIDLFMRGGLLILSAIQKQKYRVLEKRPTLRKSQLAVAALRSLTKAIFSRSL